VGVLVLANTLEVLIGISAEVVTELVEDVSVLELPLVELRENTPVKRRLQPLQRQRVVENIDVSRRSRWVVSRGRAGDRQLAPPASAAAELARNFRREVSDPSCSLRYVPSLMHSPSLHEP
jgi:hypothetical protein